MARKMADGLVNAMLDAWETFIGVSPKFQIWSGPIPDDESTAPTGVKLVEMTLPSDWMSGANNMSKSKLGTWSAAAIAAGTATFWRICSSSGTPLDQGSLTATGGGGDATIDNTNIAVSQVVSVTGFTFSGPASY